MIDPETRKRQAVTDMDDAGLAGLADGVLEIGQLAALRPQTYDEFMRYGEAIGEAAGLSRFDRQRLGTVLSELRGIEAEIANAPAGLDGMPDRRQRAALETARAEAAAYYAGYVQKALARRNTPLDMPRARSGAVDMTLVQPGFVYRTQDGALFMIDPGRKKFVEARRLPRAKAGGALYEPAAGGETVGVREMRLRADGHGPAVVHRMPATAPGNVNPANLEKGAVYEVEDGTTFRWNGEKFREVYWDGKSKAWVERSDPRDKRLPGKPGTRMSPGDIAAAAEAIQGEAERFREETDRIRGLAQEMAGVRERLRNRRLNGLPETGPDIVALMKRLADGMPKLRGMLHDLIEAAKPEVLDVEAMGGRMDLPWRPEHAANAVVQTLGDKAAGAAEFAGELRAMGAREWKDRFDRIKAGVPVPEAMERGDNALTFNVFEKYANASSNEREQMERIYVPFTDPRETAAYQWGEEMRNRVREAYPSNPRYEGDFLTDIVPRVFADIAVDAVISRGLGKALGAKEGADQISRLVSVTLEVINESSEAFRNSLKNKESIDEAYKKFGFGVVVGLTGGIPVAELLEEVNKATGGSLSGLLWESAKGGSEEAVILRIQQSLKEAERLGVVDGKEVIAAFASGGVVEFARSLVGAK